MERNYFQNKHGKKKYVYLCDKEPGSNLKGDGSSKIHHFNNSSGYGLTT